MRVADRTFPPVALDDSPELDRFAVRPVVAISGLRLVAEWDDPANVWDADNPNGDFALVGTARVGRARVGIAS